MSYSKRFISAIKKKKYLVYFYKNIWKHGSRITNAMLSLSLIWSLKYIYIQITIYQCNIVVEILINCNYIYTEKLQNVLNGLIIESGYDVSDLRLDDIEVLGVAGSVTSLTINGGSHTEWSFDDVSKVSQLYIFWGIRIIQ